jgi:hypothetical protein
VLYRQVHERDRAVGSRDDEAAVAELHVHRRDLELLRRERLAFLITRSAACTAAAPLIIAAREPPVPVRNTSWSEWFWNRWIFSNGTPSLDESTCAIGDAWPWP